MFVRLRDANTNKHLKGPQSVFRTKSVSRDPYYQSHISILNYRQLESFQRVIVPEFHMKDIYSSSPRYPSKPDSISDFDDSI